MSSGVRREGGGRGEGLRGGGLVLLFRDEESMVEGLL